jgi:hypothetical protein
VVDFVGRSGEIESLRRELDRVRSGAGGSSGRCLLVRGRRRVGKSRLLEEFCSRSGAPYVFFTASQQGGRELAMFAEEVSLSNLANRSVFDDVTPTSWDAALRLLATAAGDTPTVVVVDDFPYLVDDDPTLEATFQKQWDRLLSKKPVLLVLVGSDLAMMEALNTHGRPFFQRGAEMIVPPLSPPETATIVGAEGAAEAFDAYLLTGGLPLICAEWDAGSSFWDYLGEALTNPTSALIVSAERSLAAEFPEDAQARTVLGEIGTGERTFTNIARGGGGMQAAPLTRALRLLRDKRVISQDLPLSTKPSKEARYRVADPYLRFWLFFVGPHLAEIERGRGDLAVERVRRDWTTWRGRAIEPVIREALGRLSPLPGLPSADAVGGYWTRSNAPEIDLIGADRAPVARRLIYAGTVKWLDSAPLTESDLNKLRVDVGQVPGADPDLPLVAVSRSGVTAQGAAAALGPYELLAAW